MDKKKSLGIQILSKSFIIIFIIFTVLYIAGGTGYYEFKRHKKVELTEKQKEIFEKDLENGKQINVEDYLKETQVSYENGFTSLGNFLSENIVVIMQKGTDVTIDFFSKLFSG